MRIRPCATSPPDRRPRREHVGQGDRVGLSLVSACEQQPLVEPQGLDPATLSDAPAEAACSVSGRPRAPVPSLLVSLGSAAASSAARCSSVMRTANMGPWAPGSQARSRGAGPGLHAGCHERDSGTSREPGNCSARRLRRRLAPAGGARLAPTRRAREARWRRLPTWYGSSWRASGASGHLFGSLARGDAGVDSDVDLLVEGLAPGS